LTAVVDTVVVVGGGISGLTAAWELTGGAAGPGPDTPSVVLLEADERAGGKLQTVTVGGREIDAGPDGFLGRRPEGVELCRELGLEDELVPIALAGAAVWVGGRRRDLPPGLALGVPTRYLPIARSKILGARGSLRLLVDVVAPRRDLRGPLGDRAVGPLVAHKLGRRVVERLVDPLVGGIHAGTVADMSTAAVYPLLLAVAQQRGSFMRHLRRAVARGDSGGPGTDGRDGPGGEDQDDGNRTSGSAKPLFWTLRDGVGSLPGHLTAALVERGVAVEPRRPAERLRRGGPGEPAWTVETAGGPVAAHGLVLALPAFRAADLLALHDAESAALLRAIDHASVAVVTLEYAEESVPDGLTGTGLLVPRGSPAPRELGGELLVTACTYLDAKWPNVGRPGRRILRASVGRFGDDRPAGLDNDALVSRVAAELEVLLGVSGAPSAGAVARFNQALPQYRVHHLLRVTGIEAAVRRLPAVSLAGASYHGVGIPACVASGRTAARTVMEALSGQRAGGASLS
jgi:protoporphyrinogen/coproporphyrinogen III oxidase